MKFKWLSVCLMCIVAVICFSGCTDRSDLKNELDSIEISYSLPEVTVNKCRYLSQADEAVYEQQIAACDMYYEAYYLTRTADYTEEYEDSVKSERIAYYCNQRRTELNDEITRQLRDNIREIVKTVEDCENIEAYIDRVVNDTINFYDYYAEYSYAEDAKEFEENTCKILKVFYERTNILAFSFMAKNKETFIEVATDRIVKNSRAKNTYSMYITENNAIVEALNAVYNGIDSERAQIITDATIKLVRKMLEEDNELDEDSINTLMEQLGEPTPEPTIEPTPIPTPVPTPVSTPVRTPQPIPVRTPQPQTPAKTQAPEEWWEFST